MDLLQMRTEIGAVAECAQNVLNEETVRLCARLTEPETARDAAQRISELFVQDPGGAAKLTLFLRAACLAREKWAQIGMAEEIFWDTAACLARFVQEMRQRTGRPLFDREQWAWRQMCGRLFRLGTLEFEYVIVEKDACRPWGVQPGQAVLSVHIPGDRPLTEQSLRESYRQAAAFWEKYEAAFCPAGRPVLWPSACRHPRRSGRLHGRMSCTMWTRRTNRFTFGCSAAKRSRRSWSSARLCSGRWRKNCAGANPSVPPEVF